MADLIIEKYAIAWDLNENKGQLAVIDSQGNRVTRPISNAGELLALKAMFESNRVMLRNGRYVITGFEELIDG